MMRSSKPLVLGAVLLAASLAPTDAATNFEPTESGLRFREVREVPGKDKEELFSSTKKWIGKTFRNPEGATRHSDAGAGHIVLKTYWTPIKFDGISTRTHFDVIIDVKDGAYRMTIENVIVQYGGNNAFKAPIEETSFFKGDKWKRHLRRRNAFTGWFRNLAESLYESVTVDDAW